MMVGSQSSPEPIGNMTNLASQASAKGPTKGEPSRREYDSYTSKAFIEWECPTWLPKGQNDLFIKKKEQTRKEKSL